MAAVCMTASVGELARDEARQFEHKSGGFLGARYVLAVAAVHTLSLFESFIAGVVAGRVDKMARDLAKRAVWFHGARTAINRESFEPMDPKFELVDQLSQMEAHLLEIREMALKLSQRTFSSNRQSVQELKTALQRFSYAGTDLYEEVRWFRAAVMSYEANRGVVEEGCTAHSADDVDAGLKRLMNHA